MRQDPERFVTFVLGAFAVAFYLGLAGQILRVRRKIGRSPVSWQGGLRERLSVAAVFLWPVPTLLWAHSPRWFAGLPRFVFLENWPARLLGVLLLSLAGAILTIAYGELGEHWRLGIDPADESGFVRSGIYGSVRHPVYTAVWLAFLGIFFLAPNLLFGILWAVASSLVNLQADAEERHLTRVYGKPYRDYTLMTGRFFPLWY